ncbi:MAG: TIGR03545 family protein [Planctomycetaceae bacterium]|nr:TIGR03545 family protein [Planctomycetaceae bacterium]
MRWSYLISRGLLLGLFWALFVFIVDPLLQRGVIWGGKAVFQAEVEVEDLDTGFIPPQITLTNVAVANTLKPDHNLFEFDSAEIKLDAWGLARKKLVVEEGNLHGLKWDRPRDKSGEMTDLIDWEWESIAGLKEAALKESEKWLQDVVNKTKGELDPDQLESVRLAKQLQEDWKKRFDDLEQRMRKVEDDYKQIKRNIEFADKNPIEKVRIYAQAAQEADRLMREVQAIQQELKSLPNRAQSDFNEVELARQRDMERLKQKLDFIRLDPNAISEAMLGEELAGHLQKALEWGRWIQQNFPITEPPEPERMRGTDVEFVVAEPTPDVLIRQLNLTGELYYQAQPEPFSGILRGWTTEPAVYGKPMEIELSSSGTLQLALHSTIDQRAEIPISRVSLQFQAPLPPEQVLGNPQEFAISMAAQSSAIEANLLLQGELASGEIILTQEPVTITGLSSDPKRAALNQVLARSLSGINRLESRVSFSGDVHDLQWNVQSNLGEQISAGLSTALAQSWDAGQEHLRAQANELVNAEMQKLSQSMGTRYQELNENIKLAQGMLRGVVPQTAGGNLLNGFDINNLKSVIR